MSLIHVKQTDSEMRACEPSSDIPSVISITKGMYDGPVLWTRDGISRFSFGIEIEVSPLLARAGISDLSVLDRRSEWQHLFRAADPEDPHIIVSRFNARIDLYLTGSLNRIATVEKIGSSGVIGNDRFGRPCIIGRLFNIQSEYAHAMAEVFERGGVQVERADGFVEPKNSRDLLIQNITLEQIIAVLNQSAVAAIDLRNEIIVKTPADWGSFGLAAGALAKAVIDESRDLLLQNERTIESI